MNVTGFWTGSYWYHAPGEPVVSFLANLQDDDGQLSGSMSEAVPESLVRQRVSAFVSGVHDGLGLEFAKVYDGASLYAHRVDYVGEISDDGSTIQGHWVLESDWTGGFEMARQLVADDEADETVTKSHHTTEATG